MHAALWGAGTAPTISHKNRAKHNLHQRTNHNPPGSHMVGRGAACASLVLAACLSSYLSWFTVHVNGCGCVLSPSFLLLSSLQLTFPIRNPIVVPNISRTSNHLPPLISFTAPVLAHDRVTKRMQTKLGIPSHAWTRKLHCVLIRWRPSSRPEYGSLTVRPCAPGRLLPCYVWPPAAL